MTLRLSICVLWILPLSVFLAYANAPPPTAAATIAAEKSTAMQKDFEPLEKEGSDTVTSPQILKDPLPIEETPTNINMDTKIFLYGDPKPKKAAEK